MKLKQITIFTVCLFLPVDSVFSREPCELPRFPLKNGDFSSYQGWAWPAGWLLASEHMRGRMARKRNWRSRGRCPRRAIRLLCLVSGGSRIPTMLSKHPADRKKRRTKRSELTRQGLQLGVGCLLAGGSIVAPLVTERGLAADRADPMAAPMCVQSTCRQSAERPARHDAS